MTRWDLLFVALAAGHGVALTASPTVPVIALGLWWNSNTIAHNFIHRPFFRGRTANLVFSAYLSVLLGVPQTIWRERHLAHHRDAEWHWRASPQLVVETTLVCGWWATLAWYSPAFFAMVYLPAYCMGLMLCHLQGHYEHARGVTSHYGAIYNLLCFNDGYHVEHHANPGIPWFRLPHRATACARSSRWPPLLRWIDDLGLEGLERLVLRSPFLQRCILQSHRRAFAALLPRLEPIHRVAIVGGGLFPRTALILRELLPSARLVIVDASHDNLHTAQLLLGGSEIECVRHLFESDEQEFRDFDLVVIPLTFKGDRERVYRNPPSSAVIVHDWIWRRRGEGRVVSLALFKRLNLVRG
jgi:hypothetical protein